MPPAGLGQASVDLVRLVRFISFFFFLEISLYQSYQFQKLIYGVVLKLRVALDGQRFQCRYFFCSQNPFLGVDNFL